MRFIEIWLFMIIINILLDVIPQEIDPFNFGEMTGAEIEQDGITYKTGEFGNKSVSEINAGVTSSTSESKLGQIFNFFGAVFEIVFKLIPIFFSVIKAVTIFPLIWISIGVPAWIAWLIMAPIFYFIEFMAIYQIATGRSLKEGV